jgi:hypothetical protein
LKNLWKGKSHLFEIIKCSFNILPLNIFNIKNKSLEFTYTFIFFINVSLEPSPDASQFIINRREVKIEKKLEKMGGRLKYRRRSFGNESLIYLRLLRLLNVLLAFCTSTYLISKENLWSLPIHVSSSLMS